MTQTIKVTKPSAVGRAGTEALVKALGLIGTARNFIYENSRQKSCQQIGLTNQMPARLESK